MTDFEKLSVFQRLMKISGGRVVQLWNKAELLRAFVFVSDNQIVGQPAGSTKKYLSMKQLETRYLSGKRHRRFKKRDYDNLYILSAGATYYADLLFRDYLKQPMATRNTSSTEVNGFCIQASSSNKKRKVQVNWSPLVFYLANKYKVKTIPTAWQFVFQHLENLGCSVEEIGQLYLNYFEENASAAHSLDLARPEQ